MRPFFYIFLLSLFACTTAFAQEKPGVKKFYPETLKQISREYNVDFAYDPELITLLEKTKFHNKSNLTSSLESSLHNSGIEFTVQGNLVLLRKITEKTGQKKHIISGQIQDVITGEKLPFAIVQDNLGNYFESDSMGQFSISYDTKTPDSLFISYLGYQNINLPIKGKALDQKINISLYQLAESIPIINISTSLSPSLNNGVVILSKDNLLEGPSSIISGDIMRNIQMQAGITAHKDISAGIEIRGAESWETMINLDGMVIYNPYHFYNLFSAINGNFIESARLYKNNIPIEYTGKTGGLIEMKSSRIIKPNLELITSLDLLNSSANLSIPVGQQSQLQLAGRASYSKLSQRSFFKTISGNANETNLPTNSGNLIQSLDPEFNFYDLNARYLLKVRNNSWFDLNFFYSQDRYNNQKMLDTAPKAFITTYLFDYNDQSNWENLGVSTNYRFHLKDNIDSKFLIQYSQSFVNDDFSFENYLETKADEKDFSIQNILQNKIQDFHLNWTNVLKTNENSKITMGLETGYYKTNSHIQSDSLVLHNSVENETPISLFSEYNRTGKKYVFKAGARLSYLSVSQKWFLDPRIFLSKKLENVQGEIYSSFSINHQFLSQFSYENRLGQVVDFWVISNDRFPLIRSYNSMIGYQMNKKGFSLNAELYFKQKYGLTEYALINPGISAGNGQNEPVFNFFNGKGRVIGMDLSISKKISSFQSGLNYTLSSNYNSFDNIFNGKYYPDNDHRRHQLKWTNNYSWKEFNFYLNTVFSSGKPYIDISQLNNNTPRKELEADLYLKYLPAYFRIDLGFDHTFNFRRSQLVLGASVFNVLNRKNVYSIEYIKPVKSNNSTSNDFIPVGAESGLLGRTINLNLTFRLN